MSAIINNKPVLHPPPLNLFASSAIASLLQLCCLKDHQVCCRANYDDESINSDVDVAVIETFKCSQCDTKFDSLELLKQHRHNCHPANLPIIDFFSDTCEVKAYDSAFEGSFRI